jgi:hypothetical protein
LEHPAAAEQLTSAAAEVAVGFVAGKVARAGKKVGKLFLRGEKALTKAVINGIAGKRTVGQVGRYGDLIKGAGKGGFKDGLQAHHIPSKDFMSRFGVKETEGLSVMMTVPQHKATRTYGRSNLTQINPRSELAADLRDVRSILRKDGVYTPQVNRNLMRGAAAFKQQFPNVFRKIGKQ